MKTKITYDDVFQYFDQRTNDEFGKELSAALHQIYEREKELFSDDSESSLLEAIEIRVYSQKLAAANYLVGSDLDARVCEYAGAEALGVVFQLLEYAIKRQLRFSERVRISIGIIKIGEKHYAS